MVHQTSHTLQLLAAIVYWTFNSLTVHHQWMSGINERSFIDSIAVTAFLTNFLSIGLRFIGFFLGDFLAGRNFASFSWSHRNYNSRSLRNKSSKFTLSSFIRTTNGTVALNVYIYFTTFSNMMVFNIILTLNITITIVLMNKVRTRKKTQVEWIHSHVYSFCDLRYQQIDKIQLKLCCFSDFYHFELWKSASVGETCVYSWILFDTSDFIAKPLDPIKIIFEEINYT